jgi:hypothetical protein
MPDILALRISSGYGLNGQLRPAPPVAAPSDLERGGATKSRRGDPQGCINYFADLFNSYQAPDRLITDSSGL